MQIPSGEGAQWKNSNFRKFCWVIRTQPLSVLKIFYEGLYPLLNFIMELRNEKIKFSYHLIAHCLDMDISA